MSNLGRGRVKIKFRNSVLVQLNSSSLYSNFTLNLYIVYELNDWLYNPSHYFALKNCLLVTVKKNRNSIKSKFIYNGRGIAVVGAGSCGFRYDSASVILQML